MIKKIFLSLLVSSLLLSATYEDIVVDEVVSIYDGDSFKVNICKYHAIIGHRIMIRINGIDTPELRGKCKKEKELARAAKQKTVELLRNAKKIELKNIQRGKYFRIVADVYIDGESLGKKLLDLNLAVEYHGGTKKMDWCK